MKIMRRVIVALLAAAMAAAAITAAAITAAAADMQDVMRWQRRLQTERLR